MKYVKYGHGKWHSDNDATVIIDNHQPYGFGDDKQYSGLKKEIPFKLHIKVKKDVLKNIRVGYPFEMIYDFSKFRGAVTEMHGTKITIEGTEPLGQYVGRVLDDIDVMKYQ